MGGMIDQFRAIWFLYRNWKELRPTTREAIWTDMINILHVKMMKKKGIK